MYKYLLSSVDSICISRKMNEVCPQQDTIKMVTEDHKKTISSLGVKTQQVLIKHPALIDEGHSRSKLRSLISALYNTLFLFLIKGQHRGLLCS